MKQITFILFIILSTYVTSKTKSEWKSRSIYQILTDRFARTSSGGSCTLSKYCGGNYQGVIKHLDYIKGMGFDAIWISPIVENYPNSYHGYHLTNLYNLNSNFGSESDLKSLITGLLQKDLTKRIKDSDIQNHPYFTEGHKVDWNKVANFEIECPMKPEVNEEKEDDIQNFDSEFTQEKYNVKGLKSGDILEYIKSADSIGSFDYFN